MDELEQLEVDAVEEQLNNSTNRVRLEKRKEEEKRNEEELKLLENQLEELSLAGTQAETES